MHSSTIILALLSLGFSAATPIPTAESLKSGNKALESGKVAVGIPVDTPGASSMTSSALIAKIQAEDAEKAKADKMNADKKLAKETMKNVAVQAAAIGASKQPAVKKHNTLQTAVAIIKQREDERAARDGTNAGPAPKAKNPNALSSANKSGKSGKGGLKESLETARVATTKKMGVKFDEKVETKVINPETHKLSAPSKSNIVDGKKEKVAKKPKTA
jgi:hypothetical protein